ncbi:MAG: SGNH/GDSL hydrolase family protein [Candidatus Omnitrophota bacterium]
MTLLNPKNKSSRQNLILLAVSFALGLGSSEYIVRRFELAPEVLRQSGALHFVDNPKMVYEYFPNSKVSNIKVNNQGFNDSDFVLEKPQGLIRIAMLGDSITKGEGVPKKKTFSDKLEDILNRRERDRGSPQRYEVMNFGVGGYNLEAEVEVLKEKVLPYHPDIVILNMYWNDNEIIPGIYQLFVSNRYKLTEKQQISLAREYVSRRNSFTRWLERNVLYRSKLYLFIVTRLASFQTTVNLLKGGNIPNQFSDHTNMENIYRGFRKISQLKDQYGFGFLICIHPDLLYIESQNNYIFADIAQSFNFDCFHMFSHYKGKGISPEALQRADDPEDKCHPNEFGHDLIAEAMLLEIEKHGLIARAREQAVGQGATLKLMR